MRVAYPLWLFRKAFLLSLMPTLAFCSLSPSSPDPQADSKPFITLHTVGSSSSRLPESILEKCTKKRVRLSINFFYGKLMYTVGRKGLDLVDVRKLQKPVLPGDAVFFLFGYIDCERHVIGHSKGLNIEKFVQHLVEGYEKTIVLNAALIPGVPILVAGIRPPYDLAWVPKNRGTIKERILGTVLVNYHLRKMCARNNFTFVDFFDKYAVDNGSFNQKLSGDVFHIRDYHENTKIFIAKALGAY